MSLLNLHQFPVTFWKVQKLLSETFDWSKEHLQTVIKDHKICIILNNYWIKVEVSVISRSQRLRLITLTSALIILGITKTESNNRFIIHWTKKKWKSCFCFFTDGKQHKARELDIITRGLECPWHDYCIICRYDVKGADFENSLYAFGQSEKSKNSMYRNNRYRADHPNKCFTLPHTCIISYLLLLADQATAMAQSPMKMFSILLCLLCLLLVTFCATAGKISSQDKVNSLY